MADGTQLKRKLGISRRDLIRRGVVVGGTLLWTVPVITSISRAHVRPGSPGFVCCECRRPDKKTSLPLVTCIPPSEADNPSDCNAKCRAAGYPGGHFHYALSPITCTPDVGCATH